MLNLKTTIAASLVALCSVNASAQTEAEVQEQELGYKPQPYTFVQAQGGVGTTFTDVNAFKLLKPTFGLGVGRMFSPAFGARLHFQGYRAQGGFNYLKGPQGYFKSGVNIATTTKGWKLLNGPMKYGYNYINSDVDLMLNVVNLFSDKNYHNFNLYLIGGVGLSYAWNNSEYEFYTGNYNVDYDISNAWGDNQSPRTSLLSHNLRVGFLADYNISKHWSVGLEVDMNSLDDRFNSKYNNCDDWMMTAMATVTYKFGFKKASKPAPKPVPVVVEPEPEPEPEPVYATRIDTIWYDSVYYEESTKDRAIKKEIFFGLRESGVETSNAQINAVAAFLKKVKNAEITITSYADKGTGSAAKNMGYSKTRAEKTKKALISAGVDPKIIKKVEWKGDTEQPYAENDKNRLSVITGHGIYTDKDEVVVKKFRTKEVTYRVE